MVYWSHPDAKLGKTWATLHVLYGMVARARRRQRARYGPADLDGSRLRVLRTSQGSLFGIKSQKETSSSFVNHQGSIKKAVIVFGIK